MWPLGRGWRCNPVIFLTLMEELAWSASCLPAVGSTAPLPTEGEPSWCCCATRQMLLMDIIKDAKVSLNPADKWTAWQRTVSFLLSAYLFFLGRGWYPGPLAGTTSKRWHGEDCIKFVSIHSPLAGSHQTWLLQTPPHAFVLCPKRVTSTFHFRLWLCRALAQPSHYFKHFELNIRGRINSGSRTPYRAREEQGQVFHSMDTVLPQPSCSAG